MRKKSTILYLFGTIFAAALCTIVATRAAESAAQPVLVAQLEPTVLFAKKTPLCQIGWLRVENTSDKTYACDVVIKINGVSASPAFAQKITLAPGLTKQDLLIPDIEKASVLEVEFNSAGKALLTLRQNWQPQRKWKIHIVKSSHEDIGYEGFLWEKQKEIADYIDIGASLSRAGSSSAVAEGASSAGGYRYNLESLLFGRYYIDERGETAWRQLLNEKIKTNLMPIGGGPNAGAHFHWMDTEEMSRLLYPARREYKDRFDLDIPVFLSVDNPSISWAGAQLIANAGFKYAVRYGQPFRTGKNNDYATTGLPAIFYWKTPDATTRILYSWRNHYGLNMWFGETSGGYNDLADLGAMNIQRQLIAIQKDNLLGPYPYDAVLVPSYQDHEIPKWDNRALTRWKSLYAYPEIIISDPFTFVSYIEKNFADKIPTLSGDLNNHSADYASIDPQSQGWKRAAARSLPVAETLNAINSAQAAPIRAVASPALLPSEINHTYTRIFDYDEHSWPTSPKPGDIHRFNAQWGKQLEGRRAFDDTNRFVDQTLATLAAKVPTGEKQTLLVFNPSAQPRTDIVAIKTQKLLQLADTITGKPVATQYHRAHRSTVFVAENIPALGYKIFEITGEQSIDMSAKPASVAAEIAPVIENKFYKITFDKNSGAITSILDKELGKELVDSKAKQQFNQAILVSKKTKEGKQGTTYSPKTGAVFERGAGDEGGSVFNQISATITDKKLGDATLRQSVRLYNDLKLIEIINTITHLGALHSEKYTDRYKENFFYAFPLAVPDFTHRAEQAVGTVRPYDDQLRFGSHDFLAVNRYLNTGNDDFSVTIAPREASIFHLGEIRYNEFSTNYKPKTSHVFSYAWSNRMTGLIDITADDLRTNLHYTITSARGPWNNGSATQLGDAVATPLVAVQLPAKQAGALPAASASFLSVDQPNVRLTVFKQSEQPGRGYVLRLVETAGKDCTVKINIGNLPRQLNAATLTDLVENDKTPLQIRDAVVSVDIKASTVATLRLYNNAAALAAPGQLTATATSDSAVTLKWDAVPGAIGYNIFCSADPEEPATASTLVASVSENNYTDRTLNISTTYFYRVAALAPANAQGALAAQVSATTLDKNTTPPPPVTELGTVRLSTTSLMVCWEKSPASDTARYYVFRSEKSDFSNAQKIATVQPGGYYLEHFTDEKLKSGKAYYYRVFAEDWVGNRQSESPITSAATAKE